MRRFCETLVDAFELFSLVFSTILFLTSLLLTTRYREAEFFPPFKPKAIPLLPRKQLISSNKLPNELTNNTP